MSQPAETVWKQQLQRFDQRSWVFQRCYSLVSDISSSISSFCHLVTKSISVDDLWAPLFFSFVSYCQNGALCLIVWEHLFFLFQQKSCFQLSFIGTDIIFARTRITSAIVSDIKSMHSIADTTWIFPKRFLAFIFPDYRSRNSRKGCNFFFFPEKKSPTCLMDHSKVLDYEYKTTELSICSKTETIRKFIGRKEWHFSRK